MGRCGCYSACVVCGSCDTLSGATVAGTTDAPTEITANPHPQEVDIQFILQEIRDYLSPEISGD